MRNSKMTMALHLNGRVVRTFSNAKKKERRSVRILFFFFGGWSFFVEGAQNGDDGQDCNDNKFLFKRQTSDQYLIENTIYQIWYVI